MSAPRMSRIEMVMHLQSVDLFRSCAATEAVRLAEIAEPVELAAEDVLYKPGEPATTLFSVVEGRVLIESTGGHRREVGPHGAFGVLEVLSGRQRSGRAEARSDSLVVAIEGEDFFDLLSNNIDIVKALFREVMDDPDHSRSFEENTAGVIALPVAASDQASEAQADHQAGDSKEVDQSTLEGAGEPRVVRGGA